MSEAWVHSVLGRIAAIPPELQPKKVWAHFYAPDEHWERVSSPDPAPLRQGVEQAAGVERVLCRELPRLDRERWVTVRRLTQEHHDHAYGPAYAKEMANGATEWTAEKGGDRHFAATPKGVFIVAQRGNPAWVVTAYRPHPPVDGVNWEEADFRRHAHWRVEKIRMANLARTRQSVTEELQRASVSSASSVRELWWLASAVGYGRAFAEDQSVRDVLTVAEAKLDDTDASLTTALTVGLEWESTLDALTAALRETRPEDLERALADAEDLVAVGTALGLEDAVDAFSARAEALLAWFPAEWHAIGEAASRRSTLLGGTQNAIGRLWDVVADAALGASIRSAPTVTRPEARYVDALLGRSDVFRAIRRRVEALGTTASAAVERGVQALLDGLVVTQPSPTLAIAQGEAPAHAVLTSTPRETRMLRAFVVDEAHPEGHEVTEHVAQGTALWEFDSAADRALVVVALGDAEVAGASMEDVLNEAARRRDVRIDCREFSPSR